MPTLMNFLNDTGNLDTVLDVLDTITHDQPEDLICYLKKYRIVSNRSFSAAGRCSYMREVIELHSELLVQGREKERDDTLLHEVAHAIVYKFYQRNNPFAQRIKAHGREWKTIMRGLDANPKSSCNYDFLNADVLAQATLIYACNRCEHEFGAKRLWKRPASKIHNKCGGRLYLKKNRRTGQIFPNPRQE